MLIIYRLLINLAILFSPIIIFIRLIKKREILRDLKKSFVFFQKKEKVEN